MHYYEVAPNQIVRAGTDTLTYASVSPLEIGQIVQIEVGKKTIIGLVVKKTTAPEYATKEIVNVVEATALPIALVKLASWLSAYYKTPLATVLQTMLPRGLTTKRREVKSGQSTPVIRERTHFLFNADQQRALDSLAAEKEGTFLLEGITGSGKTAVYIELARRTLEAGESVIVLVPEIALTTQIVADFAQHFPDILLTHSQMTEAERHRIWKQALSTKTPQLVIGPRSALFMPLEKVGAIIIDEAHEPSFKQEQSPRYSALRAATMLGRYHHAKVVFGSATMLVADHYTAEQAGRPILHLTGRARKDVKEPVISLVDMTKRQNFTNHRFLSDALLHNIEASLDAHEQTLIFHNRRGSASTTLCENCGWTAICPNCFVPLTLHADHYHLRCHICDHKETVPKSCPTCGAAEIIHKGIGTKLIEAELTRLFPSARIARFDSDTAAHETLDKKYDELYKGEIDIAIGTQIIAKGLDLPKLRTVGVIQADSGLAIPDYSASERTFELLSQVIGRVGRNEHQTTVVVQSYQPTHPAVALGLAQNYETFYDLTLEERERAHFPPFTYLLKLTTVFKTEAGAVKAGRDLARKLRDNAPAGVRVLGPTPSLYERLHGTYRWQLIVKSPRREYLLELLALLPPTGWQFELDPISLL